MHTSFKVSIFFIFATILPGCSSIFDKDRKFTEPVTGAVMIARDVVSSDKKQGGCDSKPKSEREACKKEVEALTESFKKGKNEQ